MRPRARHLHEDRLFDCYFAERRGEPIDPPTAEHLADCHPCSVRYADVARFLDALRSEGDAETEAIFTPERFRTQQQQIARRLEAVARPARVITFPGRFVRGTMIPSVSRWAPRWTAAAAAAGLFLGIALGASYEWERSRLMGPLSGEIGSRARLGPVATRGTSPADVAADDAFLSELEVALERPRTSELMAFDAFTPHVREVKDLR